MGDCKWFLTKHEEGLLEVASPKKDKLITIVYLSTTKKLKLMKYFLLTIVAFISILTFSSCKKTSSSSPFYIKATINGKNVVYNGYTGAVRTNLGMLTFYGYKSNAANADGIQIYIQDTGTIGIGSYSDSAFNTGFGVTSYPTIYPATIQLQLLGTDYLNAPYLFPNPTPNSFVCTISAINSSSISGTFSTSTTKVYYSYYGDYGIPWPEGDSITITNGSFYVPF
jgi:hypothetical protein